MEELPQINWENIVGYRRAYFCPAMDNMRRLGAAVGDMATFVVMEQPVVLVTAPDLVRETLITRAPSFTVQKPLSPPPPLHITMLNSDGEAHHQRRRQIAPAFRPRYYAAPGWQQTQPRHAFIPFGEGAHVCIGNYLRVHRRVGKH